VAQGKLDVYGQLDANYVQQSAPHMKAIGAMVRRVIPTGGEHSSTTPTATPSMAPTASATATLRVSNETDPAQLHDAAAAAAAAASAFDGVVSTESVRMPTLNIDRANILTAGCSNTADFSTQVRKEEGITYITRGVVYMKQQHSRLLDTGIHVSMK
jgi:hypothetical protein